MKYEAYPQKARTLAYKAVSQLKESNAPSANLQERQFTLLFAFINWLESFTLIGPHLNKQLIILLLTYVLHHNLPSKRKDT